MHIYIYVCIYTSMSDVCKHTVYRRLQKSTSKVLGFRPEPFRTEPLGDVEAYASPQNCSGLSIYCAPNGSM